VIAIAFCHEIQEMDKHTNPFTEPAKTTESAHEDDGHTLNPYQPSITGAKIIQTTAGHLLVWSMIPSIIACAYGWYHSWSPLKFGLAIVLGVPFTLAALILNEKERAKRQESKLGKRQDIPENRNEFPAPGDITNSHEATSIPD